MSWIQRLIGSVKKKNLEDQLDDEQRFHIEMRAKRLTTAGMMPDEANRRARLLFGNQTLLKEKTLDMDTFAWIETLSQDLRYALRSLTMSPSFTAVAVGALALGIGANTAIFSLMNALVLQPLRVTDPGQLVLINEVKNDKSDQRVPTMAAFVEWKNHSQMLQDIALAGFDGDPSTITGAGHAERVNAGTCGVNFFSLLGVKPFRGRFFVPENKVGMSEGVVISESLWQRMFAADPNNWVRPL